MSHCQRGYSLKRESYVSRSYELETVKLQECNPKSNKSFNIGKKLYESPNRFDHITKPLCNKLY